MAAGAWAAIPALGPPPLPFLAPFLLDLLGPPCARSSASGVSANLPFWTATSSSPCSWDAPTRGCGIGPPCSSCCPPPSISLATGIRFFSAVPSTAVSSEGRPLPWLPSSFPSSGDRPASRERPGQLLAASSSWTPLSPSPPGQTPGSPSPASRGPPRCQPPPTHVGHHETGWSTQTTPTIAPGATG